MQKHHVDDPLDLCSVDIADQKLNHIENDQFYKFTNVAYVNAAENFLPFGMLVYSFQYICNILYEILNYKTLLAVAPNYMRLRFTFFVLVFYLRINFFFP